MRRAGSWLLAFAMSFGSLASCSLFVDTDGLSDGEASDGSVVDATSDADGSAPADGTAPADSAVDSPFTGDAGSWAFVSSDPLTESSSGGNPIPPLTVTSSANIQVGDLVVIGCDCGNAGGTINFSGFNKSALSLNIVGPRSDGEAYEAEMGWGVMQEATTNLQITATAENSNQTAFMDCTINVYRGGGPNVSLVTENKITGPDDSGNATCGPIQTVPGGLAYYIAARTSCIGTPMDPAFTQRTGINGNPNGDVVPTDGGIVQSQMNPCSGSKSSWICYMMTLSP
jgi:hypothetical protein